MDLQSLPIKDGFRLRGEAVTRLETFVDAAFAFAVTLLVVSFDHVPATFAELVDAMRRVPAFLAGFAMLALYWLAHNRYSRRYGLEDGPVIALSLALVAVVLVYIFPLRILMAGMVSFFTGGWAPGELDIQGMDDLRAVYVIYGGGFLAMNAILFALNHHALRCAALLQLDAGERESTRSERNSYLVLASSAALSITLALWLPMATDWQRAAPGLAYALLSIVMPLFGWRAGVAYQRVTAAAAAP